MVTLAQVHELMAQGNVIVETLVLFLLLFAVMLERKKMFVWHGNVMLVAAIITGLLLIMHMGPAFVNVVREGLSSFDWVAYFGMAHGILGAVAWSLGMWLTVGWAHFNSELSFCVNRRKWMLRILVLWVAALGLGYMYYVVHLVWS